MHDSNHAFDETCKGNLPENWDGCGKGKQKEYSKNGPRCGRKLLEHVLSCLGLSDEGSHHTQHGKPAVGDCRAGENRSAKHDEVRFYSDSMNQDLPLINAFPEDWHTVLFSCSIISLQKIVIMKKMYTSGGQVVHKGLYFLLTL